MSDRLVPLDIDKLKALAEDRGLTIALIMAELEVKCLPAEVEEELKARIWRLLKKHEPKVAEIKTGFPQAKVVQIK